jgi:hypothetical protein
MSELQMEKLGSYPFVNLEGSLGRDEGTQRALGRKKG